MSPEEIQAIIAQNNIQKAMESNNSNSSELEEDNIGKWELDVKPFITRLKNEILGNSETSEGVWERDLNLSRLMNEKGASVFINEISSLINTHMQFSTLTDQHILDIASEVSENFGWMIPDNFKQWEISPPTTSTYTSLSMKLYNILFSLLRIAKDGGMKRHREKSKNPYLSISSNEKTESMM